MHNEMENNNDAIGIITKINSPTETIGDLHIGDSVCINRQDIKHLNQDKT